MTYTTYNNNGNGNGNGNGNCVANACTQGGILENIDAGTCTITFLGSNTKIDQAGDYRINRKLVFKTNTVGGSFEQAIEIEISGTPGTQPVVTLNGQLLNGSTVCTGGDGVAEIRTPGGTLIDLVRLPGFGGTAECGGGNGYAVNNNGDQGTQGDNGNPGNNGAGNTGGTAGTACGNGFAGTSIWRSTRPALGITVKPVGAELVHHLAVDARTTCLVDSVVEGSPAHEAGLQTHDLILSVNGRPARAEILREELQWSNQARFVRLVVLGKGLKREVELMTGGGGFGAGYGTAGNGRFGSNALPGNAFDAKGGNPVL